MIEGICDDIFCVEEDICNTEGYVALCFFLLRFGLLRSKTFIITNESKEKARELVSFRSVFDLHPNSSSDLQKYEPTFFADTMSHMTRFHETISMTEFETMGGLRESLPI
jgi:hypothetical protein